MALFLLKTSIWEHYLGLCPQICFVRWEHLPPRAALAASLVLLSLTRTGSGCLTQLHLTGSDPWSWDNWLLAEHSVTSVAACMETVCVRSSAYICMSFGGLPGTNSDFYWTLRVQFRLFLFTFPSLNFWPIPQLSAFMSLAIGPLSLLKEINVSLTVNRHHDPSDPLLNSDPCSTHSLHSFGLLLNTRQPQSLLTVLQTLKRSMLWEW